MARIRWSLAVTTAPTAEPLDLSDAKLHLRVDHEDEDDLISSLITAARIQIEKETNLALMPQTRLLTLSDWPCSDQVVLPSAPLQEINSFGYYTSAGAYTPVSSGIYDVADVSQTPYYGFIQLAYSQIWPTENLRPLLPIEVSFDCGFAPIGSSDFAARAAIPEPLKQAMKLLVGHLYKNRETVVVGQVATVLSELPQAVQMLIANHRVYGFGEPNA